MTDVIAPSPTDPFARRHAQIYVPVAITNVPEGEERRLAVRECDVINTAVTEYCVTSGWSVEAYDPIAHTPPWAAVGAAYTAREVWDIDTMKVVEQADAIIVNGSPGGSTGVGIEMALAFGRGLPALYLHRSDVPVTRMALGMPGFMTFQPYRDIREDDGEDLKKVVSGWLDQWRPLVEAGPARRREEAQEFTPLHQRLLAAWTALSGDGRIRVVVHTRLSGDAIEHYLRSPSYLAGMPAIKLRRLIEVLDVADPAGPARSAPARLDPSMLAALRHAAAEFEWGASFAGTVRLVAEQYLGGLRSRVGGEPPGVSQRSAFDLSDLGEWRRFSIAWRNGDLG